MPTGHLLLLSVTFLATFLFLFLNTYSFKLLPAAKRRTYSKRLSVRNRDGVGFPRSPASIPNIAQGIGRLPALIPYNYPQEIAQSFASPPAAACERMNARRRRGRDRSVKLSASCHNRYNNPDYTHLRVDPVKYKSELRAKSS